MEKLIIDISEETKEQIIALTNIGASFPPKLQENIVRAIINGTSLDNIFDEIKTEIENLPTGVELTDGSIREFAFKNYKKGLLKIIDEKVKEYK